MSAARTVIRFVVLLLALAACGGDATGGEDVEVTIDITADGVEAPDRPRIAQGSAVTVVFTAFEPDNAHLHGYDLWAEVGPDDGFENRIEFVADTPGVFLIELEKDFRYLTELVVQ